jgi:hypothetical protein
MDFGCYEIARAFSSGFGLISFDIAWKDRCGFTLALKLESMDLQQRDAFRLLQETENYRESQQHTD